MNVNLHNQQPTMQFCAGNNNKKPVTKTSANDFSLLRAHLYKYRHGDCKPIIPDLLDYIAITGRVKQEDIKGIAGNGGLSIVFDLGDEVLKASLENPLEFRTHNPEIDIPFLSPVEKYGKTYFVKEAKADTENVTEKDCSDIIKRLKKSGLEPSMDFDEYRTWQVGKYKDKAYLLDTRCAVPRPDRFSRFVYDFKAFNSRVIKIIALDSKKITKTMHIDEFPRPNLSFKRGLAIMLGVMNRNKQHGQKVLSVPAIIECAKRAIFK